MWCAMRLSSDPARNARVFAQEYHDVLDTAHAYIEPAIREDIADGSIETEHPREVAEVMLLLANLWMVPLFNPVSSGEEYQRRVEVFLRIMHTPWASTWFPGTRSTQRACGARAGTPWSMRTEGPRRARESRKMFRRGRGCSAPHPAVAPPGCVGDATDGWWSGAPRRVASRVRYGAGRPAGVPPETRWTICERRAAGSGLLSSLYTYQPNV